MTRMLIPILEVIRRLVGPRRRITLVFDRGGWSPKLFQQIMEMGFDLMTYRKGHVRRISEKRFVLRKARLNRSPVSYHLHDQLVRFLKGKLRLHQVTRLTHSGKQTPILTSRWDLRDIVGLVEVWNAERVVQGFSKLSRVPDYSELSWDRARGLNVMSGVLGMIRSLTRKATARHLRGNEDEMCLAERVC
jgi:hypothetical protein